MKNKLEKFSEFELLSLYALLIEELYERGLVRTTNNPVADYGEYVVAKKLKLELVRNSQKGYDAVDSKKKRYQIKARRHTERNKSTQLGVIRNIEKKPFDFLVAVMFSADFSIKEMWKMPIGIIKKYSRFSSHQNGHILSLKGKILEDSKTVKVI
ncbi:MAG: hypothetical protein KAJ18_10850 [Candidatus Omnitrophica bacterium]|nr:hypothetical protein [Candidatus Omnitrophota bacterium]